MSDKASEAHETIELGAENKRIALLIAALALALALTEVAGDDAKTMAKEMLAKKYKYVVAQLGDKPYLTGDAFTPADAYLYVMLTWAKKFGIETGLDAYRDRVAARSSVREAERVGAAG